MRRVLAVIVCAIALSASARADEPWSGLDLRSIEYFQGACSVKASDGDERCRRGASIALGTVPVIEDVHRPDGTFTRTSKFLPPDPAKATWLYEAACGNQLWRSCMTYAGLLEQGTRLPADPTHARALIQAACHSGYSLACGELQRRQIPIEAAPTLPAPPPGLKAPPWPQAERAFILPSPSVAPVAPVFTMPPRPKPRLDQPLDPDDMIEAAVFESCQHHTGASCARLARTYEAGDPDRARFYYELACDENFRPACEKLPDGEQRRGRAVVERAKRELAPFVIVAGGLALVAVVAFVIVKITSRG